MDYNDNRRNNNGDKNENGGGKGPKRTQAIIAMIVASFIIILAMSYMSKLIAGQTNQEITYNEFLTMLEQGKIKSVEIDADQINITPKPEQGEESMTPEEIEAAMKSGKITPEEAMSKLLSGGTESGGMTYYTGVVNDPSLTGKLTRSGVEFKEIIPDRENQLLTFFLSYILPILIMVILFNMIMKRAGGGGVMGVGKSNAKVYMQKETGVTFADVAGQEEAKESLQECVDFLHNPDKYVQIGAKLPKGCLLVGPPGTGKTLLAKAVAGEANVPFFSLAGSDFVEMFVGVGASRVRDLFKDAQKNAPCIIFIDEIDAIGKSRDSGRSGGGNDEREQTLNQLLAEMDGFDSAKGILILAATNRPEILDKALLRPGRFDRRVIVEKPDLKGRVDTLKVHSKNVKMDETVDLDAIALATSGAVGSDLANMVNEAAINAVKNHREYVCQKDLFDAVEVVLVGKEKKDRIMSPEERRIVSYHETGHALIMALQKNSEPVQKITIVPRTMGALGYVMQVPEEEKYLNTEAEMRDMLVSYLGGRAAEEVFFDTVTTGASNDIEKATNIARSMVTRYGMSKKLGLVSLETVESQYLDNRSAINCSEQKAAEIDDEVQRMIKDAYKEAKRIIKDNRDVMDKLAGYLIDHETITGKEFMKILRQAKNLPEPPENNDSESGSDLAKGGDETGAKRSILPKLNIPIPGTKIDLKIGDTKQDS